MIPFIYVMFRKGTFNAIKNVLCMECASAGQRIRHFALGTRAQSPKPYYKCPNPYIMFRSHKTRFYISEK